MMVVRGYGTGSPLQQIDNDAEGRLCLPSAQGRRAISSPSLGRRLAKGPTERPRGSPQTYGERPRGKDPAASDVRRPAKRPPAKSARPDAPGRNRTCGLALRRRTLYPLSYRRARISLPAVDLTYRTVIVRLDQPFTISRSTSLEEEVLQVEIEHDGTSGYGEAQPQEVYGETTASAAAFFDEAADLLGDDPFALETIDRRLKERPGEHAAKAAVDAALHGMCGKLLGAPVWRSRTSRSSLACESTTSSSRSAPATPAARNSRSSHRFPSTSTRTCTCSRTSPRLRSARTASTSSSRR